MKNLNRIFFSVSLLFLLILSPITVYSSYKEKTPTNLNPVNLIIDSLKINQIPSHFRKTTDLSLLKNSNINLTGLNQLNISGSQQFSENNIKLILNDINTRLPFTVIDLRQESHGFVNGIPVSYENKHNNANINLSRNMVLVKEKYDLKKIKLNSELTFYNTSHIIIPKCVKNESKVCKNNSLGYIRITATDEIPPSPQNIDFFVSSINNLQEETWLHFHCKEGIGRTSTFMIFYDMMMNYNKVSAKDIISRQINLVSDFTEKDIKDITSERRIILYNLFYEYCNKYGPNFKTSFSDYLKMNDLSYESYLKE